MRQVWQVTLDRLHVGDPNEEGLFSDGDEPQLAVIVFRGTYGRPGSTRVWRQPFDSGLWPEGVAGGAAIDVPPAVGVFQWQAISSPWVMGDDIEVFGFAVGAFERDATPQALIVDKLDDTVETLHAGLSSLIEGAQLKWWNREETDRQIAALNAAVKAAGEFSWIEELGVGVASGFDWDLSVGSEQRLFTNMDGLPGGMQLVVPQALSLPFVNDKPDTSYTVTGRLEAVWEEPEFVAETHDPECRPPAWERVSLPELFEAVKNGATQLQIEMKLDDTVHTTRTAYGTELRYEPGRDDPGSFPFTPPGHHGEKLTMTAVECVNGRRADHRWNASILYGPDPPFGGRGYYSALIYIDDVDVYYQPLGDAGTLWEGSDPSSHIQIISRRYRPPH